MNNEKVLGQGLQFPIIIEDGTVKPKTGLDLIRSCIRNILAFEPGEKYFQRDFGVPLRSLLSEPNDRFVEALLDYKLQTQLPMWDERIVVEDVTVSRDGAKLFARVVVSLTGVDPQQNLDLTLSLNNIR